MGEERVEINIPDYSLRVMDGDDLVHQARVIVGKPDTPTPIFSNAMRYILVNPIWRVPDSIVKKELAPHLAEDPTISTRRGYEVSRDRRPHRSSASRPARATRSAASSSCSPTNTPSIFTTRPRAGCSRRLGGLSATAACASSSRCGWPNWSWAARAGGRARLQSLIGATERTVFLPHAIPIHLEYFTEFVDASGALQDREDIYGIAAARRRHIRAEQVKIEI